jgi:hypothetical protein
MSKKLITEEEVVDNILNMKELRVPMLYDPEKLKYNAKYKEFDYFANKFPNGWQYIPGFDRVIDNIRETALTPLQEMNLRREESKLIYLQELRELNLQDETAESEELK